MKWQIEAKCKKYIVLIFKRINLLFAEIIFPKNIKKISELFNIFSIFCLFNITTVYKRRIILTFESWAIFLKNCKKKFQSKKTKGKNLIKKPLF